MRPIHSVGNVVGGALLIAGTMIGVGMLALPVVTGPSGFIPSASIYFICWVFMVCTALLFVEVSLWLPSDTSFISMADKLLGPIGRHIYWVAYLFLFLTVMIAHIAGGGSILCDILSWDVSNRVSSLIYVAVIAPVIYLGTRSVDRINKVLISGVILSYLAFVAVSWSSVSYQLLSFTSWSKTWIALPILFTAFTFQIIIPTLMTYMKRDVPKIRLAIFIGSSIPLVIYLVWEFIILGIVPPDGLTDAARLGQNAVAPLRYYIANNSIFTIGKAFAFFAMTTSFVPLALSFFDFMADGLKIKKVGMKKASLVFAIFGIPTIFALIYPNIFLVALGYAGGISCALLFGLMPPIMAWVGRYIKKYPSDTRQLPGGKPLLVVLMAFALLILAGEVIQQIPG
ncbi:MAG: Tyrosine transporter [Parachlamydiales bacterium]|nr:Tyrosine transporter [Parachlamydiales bacterium]